MHNAPQYDDYPQKRVPAQSNHPHVRRSPLTAVKLLLPIWGHRYVSQFLELGLPTLIAPGNIPALAKTLPCEFEILTSSEDETYVRQHPTFHRLTQICRVFFRRVDHLVMVGNNSTTLTLAYAEAVRATGPSMLDTCFFFLAADYIVADGSLANVLARMQAGSSAVQVGNFQVIAEEAMPWLRDQMVSEAASLAFPARQLMRWALAHLHPATIANTVNSAQSHNTHTNRLFWRADRDTLVGRFFLMHMIAIRPEVTNFNVGASCDYSFIPEMCPSGNVSVLTDSDDFLVVEMQPRTHESELLRPGPLPLRTLVRSLGEWTTAQHRENAAHSLVYHAGEVPESLPAVRDTADRYVARVIRGLRAKPKPHNGHPYWLGAAAALREATRSRISDEKFYVLLGEHSTRGFWIEYLRGLLFGLATRVRPWHPRWPDYRPVLRALTPFLVKRDRRLLLVSDTPTLLSIMLAEAGEEAVRLRTTPLTQSALESQDCLFGRFDACVLEFDRRDREATGKAVRSITPLMKGQGRIIIAIREARPMDRVEEFGAAVAEMLRQQPSSSVIVEEVRYVPAIRGRWRSYRIFARLGTAVHQRPWLGITILAVVAGPLILLTLVLNLIAASRTRTNGCRGMASSLHLVLEANPRRQVEDVSRT